MGAGDKFGLGRQVRHAAIDLPSICVPLYLDIQQAQALLLWIRDIRRQQNSSRAGTEHAVCPAELLERRQHVFCAKKLQHRSALATGNHQAIHGGEFARAADKYWLRP